MKTEEIMLIKKLKSLYQKMINHLEKYQQSVEKMQNFEDFENLADQDYMDYWNIIHNEVSPEIRNEIENRIGTGNFIDSAYIDTLEIIFKELSWKVCYMDYTLKKAFDPFGYLTYCIYDPDNDLVEENFDWPNDDAAYSGFYRYVDEVLEE